MPYGVSGSLGGGGNPCPERRPPNIEGWTLGSLKRHQVALMCMVIKKLRRKGYLVIAVTHTVRDCPPTAEAWQATVKRWLQSVARAGAVGVHCFTEWQARGVPHLHGIVIVPGCLEPDRWLRQIMGSGLWLRAAGRWGASLVRRGANRSQSVEHITSGKGWLRYCAKHAARGVRHYQRARENIPAEWRYRTGRMYRTWGVLGERERREIAMPQAEFDKLRRRCRAYRLAEVRRLARSSDRMIAAGGRVQIRAARQMLRGPPWVSGFCWWGDFHILARGLLAWDAGTGEVLSGFETFEGS